MSRYGGNSLTGHGSVSSRRKKQIRASVPYKLPNDYQNEYVIYEM